MHSMLMPELAVEAAVYLYEEEVVVVVAAAAAAGFDHGIL
jgi:hypothetical protein